jgi:hypothetical protein
MGRSKTERRRVTRPDPSIHNGRELSLARRLRLHLDCLFLVPFLLESSHSFCSECPCPSCHLEAGRCWVLGQHRCVGQ